MRTAHGPSAIAGAPVPTPARSAGGRPWVKVTAIAAIAAGALFTVVACTSGSNSSTAGGNYAAAESQARSDAGSPDVYATSAEGAPAPESGAAADSAESGSAGLGAVALDSSKVIKTADLAIRLQVEPTAETDDAATDREANAAARAAATGAAGAAARGIATGVGGFLASADGGGSSLAITVRVPADQYDTALERLGALGEVTGRTESSQDVTAEVVDVNSRVESMTASVARVRALLAQATTIAEVISIESELSVREANLESLQQQQASLSGQVAMSTISVSFTAVTDDPTVPPPAEQSGFVAGITAGWDALMDFFRLIGGAIGAFLPFLPLVAIAVVIIWWPIRRARRRRAAANAATPPADPAPAPQSQEPPVPAGAGVG